MIFILFIWTVLSKKEDCLQSMKQYFDLPKVAQFAVASRQIEMSGDWANKFGFYDMCLREDNHYSSVKINAFPLSLQFLYGFCHTNICDADDFNSDEGQELIKNYLNQSLIGKMFHIDFTQSQLQFYNPITYYPDFEWGSIFTVVLIFGVVGLSLIDPYKRFLDLLSNCETTKPSGIIADFSLIENYRKLMNLKTIDPNLAVFNGVRSTAFMMVVFGHSALLIIQVTYQLELLSAMSQWKVLFIINMLYSVDIFFWLGGFFMAFVMCEKKRASALGKNPASVFIVILHRLLRIWPCYILCMMINSYLIPFAGEGPRWWQAQSFTGCSGGSWRNLLFIDNFFHDWKLCFGWGWYLTCDIQLFIICLIPMMMYAFGYKKFAKYLITTMMTASLIYGIVICFKYGFLIPAKCANNNDFYYKYYVNSLARAPPYLFGLLLGMLYREFKQKEDGPFLQWSEYAKRKEFRVIFQILCYSFGTLIIIWLFFGWKEAQVNIDQNYWPEWFQHIFSGVCRTLFVVGVTLLCLPNIIGIHDVFNIKLMNSTFVKFAAKISFSCYLIHYMVLLYLNHTFFVTPTYLIREVTYLFVGCLVITMIAGTFLTMLVEMPFGAIQVKLMDAITKPKKKQQLLLE